MHRDSFAVFAYTRTNKSQYAPATLASDVSRLLDPTYAYGTTAQTPQPPRSSTSSPSSTPYTQAKAYVDQSGELHDPDYRDFPTMPASSRRTGTRARRASSPLRYSRPMWEQGYGSEEEAEEEEQMMAIQGNGRWLRGTASMMTFVDAARPRSGSNSTMNTLTPPEPINFHHRPSFEEDVLFEEDAHYAQVPATKETCDDDDKPTPSCIDGLRYQFQAFRLGLRLKIFRTQRRWRERRNSDADG